MKYLLGVALSAIIIAVGLIPTWIWLAVRGSLDPTTFWEKFVILGAGVWILGGIQLAGLATIIGCLIFLWTSLLDN